MEAGLSREREREPTEITLHEEEEVGNSLRERSAKQIQEQTSRK